MGLREGTATDSATVTRIITPPLASITPHPEVPGPRNIHTHLSYCKTYPETSLLLPCPQGPSVLHPAVREPMGISPLSGCLPIWDLPWIHASVESKTSCDCRTHQKFLEHILNPSRHSLPISHVASLTQPPDELLLPSFIHP